MTSNQILTASFLDILFENRNKEYGAYSIRKAYPKHLMKAVGLMLFVVSCFAFVAFKTNKKNNTDLLPVLKDSVTVVITEIELEKPREPEPQRSVPDQPPTRLDRPPVIVDNPDPNKLPPDRTDTSIVNPGTTNSPGTGDNPNYVQGVVSGTGDIINDPEPQPTKVDEPIIYERVEIMPEFPERYGNVFSYLQKKMQMPYELENNIKKTVKVKFVVNINGDVTDAVITQSAGSEFDAEVLRVISRMPKWKPGTINGKPVAVYFIQVVTFKGPEE